MARREKQWRRILSTSLLDATVPSDEVSSKSDCENRTVVWFEKKLEKRHAGTWLSRLPLMGKLIAGTSIQRPRSISQNVIAVFVGCRTMTFPAAPC